MATNPKCAYCREEITGEPIRQGGKLYCCEACAFEASQRTSCTCGTVCTVGSSFRYNPKPKK